MKRVLLFALVAMTADAGRFDRFNSRCDQGRSSRGLACASGVALANAPRPGDLSGAWWAMYGDGTMRSGSAVTLVATGSPTNTVENGWPVRTYTAAQNDQEPSNVALPASDFSVCYHRRSDALPNVQLMAFGTSGGAPATYTALPFEQQVSGNIISLTSNGAAATNFSSSSSPLPLVAGAWNVLCFTYQRVGGAADNVGTLYVNGVQVGTSSVQALANATPSVWSTNGYAAASGGSAGSTRGVFVTYKLLSAADVARISAATAP